MPARRLRKSLAMLTALVSALAIVAFVAPGSAGAAGTTVWVAKPMCAAAAPGHRSCLGMRLVRERASGAEPERRQGTVGSPGSVRRTRGRLHAGPARQGVRRQRERRRGVDPDGGDRRRLRRPEREDGPRRLRLVLRDPGRDVLVVPGRQPGRQRKPAAGAGRGVGRRDHAGCPGRARAVPQVQDPAGRGRLELERRPGGGRGPGRDARREGGQQLLRRSGDRREHPVGAGVLQPPRRRDHRLHR